MLVKNKTNKYKLAKAGGLYFLGNIFDKAIAFITVPIFTRILSTTDYGYMATYLSWISILTVVITLSLGNSVRSAIVDFPNELEKYMSSMFALGTLSSLVITFMLLCFSIHFPQLASPKIILLCCANAYAVGILTAIKWRYIMELRYVARTLLQCLPNLFAVCLAIILIVHMQQEKFLGRIYTSTGVFLGFASVYLVYYFMKGKTIFNRVYWKYALLFSIPLIFHGLSNVILSQVDRTMLTVLRSASETGIYGLAYQFGMLPLVITTTMENVWIPWFTKQMEGHNKQAINLQVKPYINSTCMVCVGIVLTAPEVIKFMTPPSYHSAIYLLSPVVCATFFMFLASISIDLEYYLKKTGIIAQNTIIASIVNILLNFIFIPKYGALAAAYTTLISYALCFGLHYFFTRRLENNLFPFVNYLPATLIMLSLTGASSYLISFPLFRWIAASLLGIIFVIYAKTFFTGPFHFPRRHNL